MAVLTEDAICEAVARHLEQIKGVKATWVKAGRRGIDIRADAGAEKWAIEAKGGAQNGTEGDSFAKVSKALMTTCKTLEKEEFAGYRLGIAVPESRWFKVHVESVSKVLSAFGITVFFVDEGGSVREYEPSRPS